VTEATQRLPKDFLSLSLSLSLSPFPVRTYCRRVCYHCHYIQLLQRQRRGDSNVDGTRRLNIENISATAIYCSAVVQRFGDKSRRVSSTRALIASGIRLAIARSRNVRNDRNRSSSRCTRRATETEAMRRGRGRLIASFIAPIIAPFVGCRAAATILRHILSGKRLDRARSNNKSPRRLWYPLAASSIPILTTINKGIARVFWQIPDHGPRRAGPDSRSDLSASLRGARTI